MNNRRRPRFIPKSPFPRGTLSQSERVLIDAYGKIGEVGVLFHFPAIKLVAAALSYPCPPDLRPKLSNPLPYAHALINRRSATLRTRQST